MPAIHKTNNHELDVIRFTNNNQSYYVWDATLGTYETVPVWVVRFTPTPTKNANLSTGKVYA